MTQPSPFPTFPAQPSSLPPAPPKLLLSYPVATTPLALNACTPQLAAAAMPPGVDTMVTVHGMVAR